MLIAGLSLRNYTTPNRVGLKISRSKGCLTFSDTHAHIQRNGGSGCVLSKPGKPPGYESSSGIEGAGLFIKKPTIECLGLNDIGKLRGAIAQGHQVASVRISI